jgi:hypothetical protein
MKPFQVGLLALLIFGANSCGNPTARNAVRIANENAARSGSEYRYRVLKDGNTIEKYRVSGATSR